MMMEGLSGQVMVLVYDDGRIERAGDGFVSQEVMSAGGGINYPAGGSSGTSGGIGV